jgi:hypothetical protein
MDTLGQWAYDLIEAALSILPDSPFAFCVDMDNSVVASGSASLIGLSLSGLFSYLFCVAQCDINLLCRSDCASVG